MKQSLLHILTKTPKPARVITDANPVGLDAVLAQEKDGEYEVVSYTSRSLTDRKSTRLNSSHANISYAVFCLKKKKKQYKGKYNEKKNNGKKRK